MNDGIGDFPIFWHRPRCKHWADQRLPEAPRARSLTAYSRAGFSSLLLPGASFGAEGADGTLPAPGRQGAPVTLMSITAPRCTAHTDPMNTTLVTVWLPLLVLVPCLCIWVYSVVDFSSTEERDMRTFPRDVWIVLLVLA
jgi:hypothetical protein